MKQRFFLNCNTFQFEIKSKYIFTENSKSEIEPPEGPQIEEYQDSQEPENYFAIEEVEDSQEPEVIETYSDSDSEDETHLKKFPIGIELDSKSMKQHFFTHFNFGFNSFFEKGKLEIFSVHTRFDSLYPKKFKTKD